MSNLAKVPLILTFVLLGALFILRITGLDPEYMDYTTQEYNERGRMTLPGLWLSGEVVKEPIENWDWVLDVAHPERGNTIMVETQPWYGIPYSVTVLPTPRGKKMYIGGSARDARLERDFPYYKKWWVNVERDPRVRLKIDGKIYNMTARLVHDPVELSEILGREAITKTIGEDGSEQLIAKWYYWEVFQRNIVEY
jgi:hypothetical protein